MKTAAASAPLPPSQRGVAALPLRRGPRGGKTLCTLAATRRPSTRLSVLPSCPLLGSRTERRPRCLSSHLGSGSLGCATQNPGGHESTLSPRRALRLRRTARTRPSIRDPCRHFRGGGLGGPSPGLPTGLSTFKLTNSLPRFPRCEDKSALTPPCPHLVVKWGLPS